MLPNGMQYLHDVKSLGFAVRRLQWYLRVWTAANIHSIHCDMPTGLFCHPSHSCGCFFIIVIIKNEFDLGGVVALLLQDHRTMLLW